MSSLAIRPQPESGQQVSAIRSILVPLTGAAEDNRCLRSAAALAARTGAHISALYVLPDPLEQLTSLSGADIPIPESVLAHQAARNAEQTRAVEAEFAGWRHEAGLVESEEPQGAKLHIERGERRAVIGAAALLADIVICALPGHTHPARFESITSAVFEAGRPVLAVPMQAPVPAFAAQQVAALAWNGTPESARSLTAALPLLGDCAELVVLSFGTEDSQGRLGPVLAYLRCHGIRAWARSLAEQGDAGGALHRAAHEVGARLLVMGAFGHNMTRELVFGGVTEFMLKNATVPLLMAH